MRVRFEPIKVSNNFLNGVGMRAAVMTFLDAAAEDIRIDFGVATQTWKDKPVFEIEVRPWNERQISTDHRVFRFVSGGTKVRRALLSPDWQSKTQPNVLGSGPGRGRVVMVSKKFHFPGIKARNFAHIIVEKWNPRLPSLFCRIIQTELSR